MKRIAAVLLAAHLLLAPPTVLFTVPVYAQENDGNQNSGRWVLLTDGEIQPRELENVQDDGNIVTSTTYPGVGQAVVDYEGSQGGDVQKATVAYSFTVEPMESFRPGEEITAHYSISLTSFSSEDEEPHFFADAHGPVLLTGKLGRLVKSEEHNPEPALPYEERSVSPIEAREVSATCRMIAPPPPKTHNDRVVIMIQFRNYDAGFLDILYTYEFVPDEGAVAVGGAERETSAPDRVEVDTEAAETKGEASTAIPAAIAVGVAATVAAIAAAGAVTGSGSGETGEDKRRSAYKMVLYKDFGNAIRYDKQEVAVYARIVELPPGGSEIPRDDLTQRIQISSGGEPVRIRDAAFTGGWMGALVWAQSVADRQNSSEGVVSFRFIGEGGSYQNNVRFRLIGNPHLSLPEGTSLTMVEGDGRCYQLPFTLMDFLEEAEARMEVLSGAEHFIAGVERTGKWDYIAKFDNLNAEDEQSSIERKHFIVTITAENAEESAHQNVDVFLCPEGLSLRGAEYDREGRVIVRSFLGDEDTEAGKPVPYTSMTFDLVVPGERDGKPTALAVDLRQAGFEMGELYGNGELGARLAEIYSYEVTPAPGNFTGTYRFQPLRQLPEIAEHYEVMLPVKAEYDGRRYELHLRLFLAGEAERQYQADKQRELTALLAWVRRCMPQSYWLSAARMIREELPRLSPAELYLMRKQIYYTYRNLMILESESELKIAEMADWMVNKLELMKWIGDQALSVLINTYGGPAGPFIDAIGMPFKDLLLEWIGEWYAAESQNLQRAELTWRRAGDAAASALESLITGVIDKDTSPKKAAGVLAAFLIVNFLRHYAANYDKPDRDVYDALMDAFGDLTKVAFKTMIQQKFTEKFKTDAFQKWARKPAGKWVHDFLARRAPELREMLLNPESHELAISTIQKYTEELCGEGVGMVYEGAKGAGEFIAGGGKIAIPICTDTFAPGSGKLLYCELDLGAAMDRFTDYLMELAFGGLFFPQSRQAMPKKPIFYPKKQI